MENDLHHLFMVVSVGLSTSFPENRVCTQVYSRNIVFAQLWGTQCMSKSLRMYETKKSLTGTRANASMLQPDSLSASLVGTSSFRNLEEQKKWRIRIPFGKGLSFQVRTGRILCGRPLPLSCRALLVRCSSLSSGGPRRVAAAFFLYFVEYNLVSKLCLQRALP